MILSVIVPTFNRANLLSRSLPLLIKTLEKSSLNDVEVILADNNSSDATPDIARNISELNKVSKVKFSVIRHQENIGVIPSLFGAMKITKGDYVTFVGDDDGLFSEGLEGMLAWLRTQPDFSIAIESESLSSTNHNEILQDSSWVWKKGLFLGGSAFYKVGNAWAGVYNGRYLRNVLDNQLETVKIFGTSVWGQSSLAFTVADSSQKPIGIYGPGFGGQILDRPFEQGGVSILSSLKGLIDAASYLEIGSAHRKPALRSLVAGLNSPVNAHLWILMSTTPPAIDAKVSNGIKLARRKLSASGVKLPPLTHILFFLLGLPILKSMLTRIRKGNESLARFSENHY
jgi:glycosyltransferase involved in cell wall biosynthesis